MMTPGQDALAGMRVLDFSIMIAGPYCARLLADVGADVIKIEPPEGDDMRQRAPLRDGHGSYFGQLNAGKRSIVLDLKRPEAIEQVRRLADGSDVVVENFRPGVMQRLGLGYEALAAINPRIVYCSISGYGQSGPGAARPAYAPIVHAASGLDRTLMRYAGDRTRPANGAVFTADILGAVYAFAAIQTALVQRARTGHGQHIDVALMDSVLNLLVYELQEAQFSGAGPRQTYGPVAASDGDLIVTPITQRNLAALCKLIDRPELLDDSRFASLSARNASWPALMGIVESWTRSRTLRQCLEQLSAAGVPSAAYADPADTLRDPHLIERGAFARVSDGGGSFIGVNPPYKMSGTRAELRERVPGVGEHSEQVFKELPKK
jgi:crotonobetainyl-CoA:carnitine CoA-transferase CaiB-like acyl-CoA transferase